MVNESHSPINEIVRRIIWHIAPGRGDRNLELLLQNIQFYLERAGGRGRMERAPRPHPKFNGSKDPLHPSLASELKRRLVAVMEHRLTSPQRVEEALLAGLHPPSQLLLSRRQVSLIRELNSDPTLGLVKLARNVKASPRTTKRELHLLREHYGFHVTHTIDPHQFKLAHYGVLFRTKSLTDSREFEEWLIYLQSHPFSSPRPSAIHPSSPPGLQWVHPLMLDYAFDVGYREGYLACYIPAREDIRRAFTQLLNQIEKRFLDLMEVHRVRGFYSNVSFECYNFVEHSWVVEADLRTEAVLQFILQHGEPFQPPRGFVYASKPASFDRIDWILAAALSSGVVSSTLEERRDMLKAYGFSLSSKTVWARERRLKERKAVFPYLAFTPSIFQERLCLAAHCPQETNRILEQISVQYPFTILHPTDLGALLLLGSPVPASSLAIHLHRTISNIPKVDDTSILTLTRLPQPQITASLNANWNPAKQSWLPIKSIKQGKTP